MLDTGVDESAIWKAIKVMADNKVGAMPYGYHPSRAEEPKPLVAEPRPGYGEEDPATPEGEKPNK